MTRHHVFGILVLHASAGNPSYLCPIAEDGNFETLYSIGPIIKWNVAESRWAFMDDYDPLSNAMIQEAERVLTQTYNDFQARYIVDSAIGHLELNTEALLRAARGYVLPDIVASVGVSEVLIAWPVQEIGNRVVNLTSISVGPYSGAPDWSPLVPGTWWGRPPRGRRQYD